MKILLRGGCRVCWAKSKPLHSGGGAKNPAWIGDF
jgi:hypothetical protein